MKLQLWSTVNGEPDELLGEVDISEEEWHAQGIAGAYAANAMSRLHAECG
jgi:hypothetical protein